MSKEERWNNCLEYIKERIPEQAFQTWFDGIAISTITSDGVVLQVPNQFHYEWLESKYRHLIDSAVKEFFDNPLIVNYSVVVSNKKSDEIPPLIQKENTILSGYHEKTQLHSRYTFESFIEGKGNQLAKAASVSVSEKPGQTPFNPLLIYSGTGLGKTHLLQATGNYCIRHFPSMRVRYLTSEKFMLDFIRAIQENKSADFANTYRGVDMLLLDDVQFFQNKEQTQEQFFHLFNELYQQGKQIILTTDRPPAELKGLKDRLISRFQSGLMVDIQPPDLETRIAILMKKAEDDKLEISFDIIEYIASHIKRNVRELEGTMVRLLALSSLYRKDITMELAQKVLEDILGRDAFMGITIDHVVKYTSKEWKVSERQLMGKGRKMEVAMARQIAMYISRELTSASLFNIGMHLGGRDHSTVIHACRTIEKKMSEDKELKKRIEKMKKELSPVSQSTVV
ncbi:MAG: chromosomal replication initiator protein DnaA [Candidatus Marinimicrobia bacterium]|nr:chromosomal replication initiator protein DnaA [Candidatus Neomarinimicrobiota bacterium]MBT3633000.1 chromosomal replication initiator protein DnaA [Candidatus Neomarinimicrobiota bacterium]MBT3682110.1 chromosomal replication initiator protein DnaA [Candidatus Neomarinimicrobiota bacterium]MBT3760788.1 chromosomal replication initiator protein DnaA [Candidatus Neomarinimicrobiota bacterium]MBT3895240.1 chromosomal replication initiator protein DnaA [Candidatus Neomarinimicrobiota bacterium